MNKLRLNKAIYDIEYIKVAIEEYDEISLISVYDADIYWELMFTENKYDINITKKEFENHLIDLINIKRI